MRRRSALVAIAAPASLLGGCATPKLARVDASLFPRTASEPQALAPGRVAVRVPLEVGAQEARGEQGPAQHLRIPIGRIVGQALTLAAAETFAGGARQIDTPAPGGTGLAATLSLDRIWTGYHSRLLWMVPLPWLLSAIGDVELDAQVGFEATLANAQGQPVWTRNYDSGALVWEHKRGELDQADEGLLRLTHQAAWRMAQKAVADLREWVLADRMRPREL